MIRLSRWKHKSASDYNELQHVKLCIFEPQLVSFWLHQISDQYNVILFNILKFSEYLVGYAFSCGVFDVFKHNMNAFFAKLVLSSHDCLLLPKANLCKNLKLYNFNCWIIKSTKKLLFDTKNLNIRVPKALSWITEYLNDPATATSYYSS